MHRQADVRLLERWRTLTNERNKEEAEKHNANTRRRNSAKSKHRFLQAAPSKPRLDT